MAYGTIPFEKRIKENITNYDLENLFSIKKIGTCFQNLRALLGVELLLTERHGEKTVLSGDFDGFEPDVVSEPGRKLRIAGRTMGHLYVKLPVMDNERAKLVNQLLDGLVNTYEELGEREYLHKETAIYADELEQKVEKERFRIKHNEGVDALTGVLNKTFFGERVRAMERAGIAPAADICININDWKFVNDNYGDEESNRLIRIIADIIKKEAGENYIIGRVDGDVFHIIIPVPEEGEAKAYCDRVQDSCLSYEDTCLAPSVAVGMVYKTNVEEAFADLFSDAEYEMFNNKFAVKNAPGYRERLEKGRHVIVP